MADRVDQAGRHLGHQDPQIVVVVHGEHLWHKSRADRVGLASLTIDSNPHPPASLNSDAAP